jgi:hypothetical protein
MKPIVPRDRSILTYDAWKTIAKSLRISDRELEIIKESSMIEKNWQSRMN